MKSIIDYLFRNTEIILTSAVMSLVITYLSSSVNLDGMMKAFFILTIILFMIAGGVIIYNACHIGRCPECGEFVPNKNRVEECHCRIEVQEWVPTWSGTICIEEE